MMMTVSVAWQAAVANVTGQTYWAAVQARTVHCGCVLDSIAAAEDQITTEHCHQLYIAGVCVQVLQVKCLVLHLWAA